MLASVATNGLAQGRAQRLCVFGIGGARNAQGGDDRAKSPKVPKGVLAYDARERRLVPADDPLPGGVGGSPWPAFGVAFQRASGVNLTFVQCAGGGYQTAKLGSRTGARTHWDLGGSLVSLMFLTLDDALKFAKNAGYDARLSGILWCQGEDEGSILHSVPNFITVEEYKTAFRNMVARFRAYYSPTLPFYIFRTGSPDPKGPAAPTEPGFALIRNAQEDLAKTIPNVIIASRLATQFAERGQLIANIIYNQEANNELGRDGALNVVASKLWNVW